VKSLKAKQFSHSKVNGRGRWEGACWCLWVCVGVCVCVYNNKHGRQSNCKIIHIAKGPVLGLSSMPHTNTDTYSHTPTHTDTQTGRNTKESGKGRRNYKERMFRLISKHSRKRVKEAKKNEKKCTSYK